ncbi:hypothetical protein [Sphingomonas sp. OTU376]|uniref:hypothetical protein n=1 Tax=Sphingomonas sp. OTU376 TaxID=3043863 RepID=UPI00313D0A62|eukprot:TRINITY_DN33373_c0_g1_i1.p3 TRINITY_DN33373_c0_g1~~TRINITY_DN33373_c0_g1_i1.p3  ORF type:complete len:101 (+),score=29.13 TRINITY_DN33373_c0_g1_i1:127-429(+)
MRKFLLPIIIALPLLSGGCIAKTVVDVATMPVRAGAQAADWATTSQDEADRNYGRKMREKEAREGKELRKLCKKHPEDQRCQGGGADNGFRADPGGNRYN